MKRLAPNAYVLDLPFDMGINSTFSVEDLVSFRGPTAPPDDQSSITAPNHVANGPNQNFEPSFCQSHFPQPSPPPPPKAQRKEIVENILDDQPVSTRQEGIQKFLLKWRDKPQHDSTWITHDELQHREM